MSTLITIIIFPQREVRTVDPETTLKHNLHTGIFVAVVAAQFISQ